MLYLIKSLCNERDKFIPSSSRPTEDKLCYRHKKKKKIVLVREGKKVNHLSLDGKRRSNFGLLLDRSHKLCGFWIVNILRPVYVLKRIFRPVLMYHLVR